jgi:hypothetical protein
MGMMMEDRKIDIPENSTVLMVMAHPDDEVILGFPILQDERIKKKILICSSDLNNPERQWCSHRKVPLGEICRKLDIEHKCLDYDSEFYRMNTRQEMLSKMMQHVSEEIDNFDYDYIFTHNVLGEYGHIDHQIVHQIVMQKNVPCIFSDIFIRSNWCPYGGISDLYASMYNFKCIGHVENDMNFYNMVKNFYLSHNVWTWSKDPVRECGLYLIKG